jgi:hypothetical protein
MMIFGRKMRQRYRVLKPTVSYFGVGFDGDWSFVNFVQGKGDSDQLDGED